MTKTTAISATGAALLLAACFSPTYPQGLACSPTNACPPEQVCDLARHVCVSGSLPQTPVLTAANDALSWTASPGATGYVLERSKVAGGPYATLVTLTATRYVDTDFDDGDTFYYVVHALDAAGSSGRSNQVSASPLHQMCVTGSGFIATFLTLEDGDRTPLRRIAGSSTQLTNPYGIAVDLDHDEIFVANYMTDGVTVFSRTADGDVAPRRMLAGSSTGLATAYHVAVDPVHDEMYVVNYAASSITVYPRTANGDVAPLRTIQGPSTQLSGPYAIALDRSHDELVVANISAGTYVVFPRTAGGDVAPLRRVIAGGSLTGIGVDESHDEIIASHYTVAVEVYDRLADGGSATPLRTLNVAAYSAIVDLRHDELVVTRSGGVSIFDRSATGSDGPARTIAGGSTGFGNAWFAAVCL